jgi:hypothetical protein
MLVTAVARLTMRGTSPPPIVPEMPTTDEPTASPEVSSDGGEASEARRTSSEFRSDGGEHRSLPERSFGAPLVPDWS